MSYRTGGNKHIYRQTKIVCTTFLTSAAILQLPLSADKVPQLVADVTARSRGCVDVDGRGQVCSVVHCKRRKQRETMLQKHDLTEHTRYRQRTVPPFKMLAGVLYSHLILVMR